MAPRLATRPVRDNDFSNVGKMGRRTGVTLPQGRLDVHGMEEISGIFSSPRKPSPLRKSMTVIESVEERATESTPTQSLSVRKPISSRKSIPPRSASPRKSGISGTARRSKTVDLLASHHKSSPANNENGSADSPLTISTLLASAARRFSPNKTPMKNTMKAGPATARTNLRSRTPIIEPSVNVMEGHRDPEKLHETTELIEQLVDNGANIDDYVLPAVGDEDDQASIAASQEDDYEEPLLPPQFDDEDADQTFEPEVRNKPRSREPTVANSRRKRKSDALDQNMEVEIISSPAAKRAKRISDQGTKSKPKEKAQKPKATRTTQPKSVGRSPLHNKSPNIKLSTKQQTELDNIIEKVKARPGKQKSLYVLRRETPEDEGMTHTRSGRVSIKPLAYWRNERCVFQDSPRNTGVRDGARFPINSIKEIIRNEEVSTLPIKKSKRTKKAKAKRTVRSKSVPDEVDNEIEEESESEPEEDVDAEPWETEKGIFRGHISVFDPEQQTAGDEEEEIDIAYAQASIETREVKGSTFRYAKLLSTKFLGSGIVDLPPGGIKKAKNSRKMHMSFFVATGRVSVSVGPAAGDNQFSIGQGGWWQVPRSNWYSIENHHHQKSARIFFSQACGPVQPDDDE